MTWKHTLSVALLLAAIAGALLGGYGGARFARQIRPAYVRRFVMLIAWSMTAYFFVRTYGG